MSPANRRGAIDNMRFNRFTRLDGTCVRRWFSCLNHDQSRPSYFKLTRNETLSLFYLAG